MSERRDLAGRLAPLALVVVLAAASLLPTDAGLELADADASAANRLANSLDALPDQPLVLVGFDPDLGTYAEVRPTVRTLIADLLERGARLAFISLTPEGRALAVTELERIREAGIDPSRVLDLGYLPGSEAALVSIADVLDDGDSVLAPDELADEAPALAVVVGGNDLGPRSWVEQVEPRTPGLPIAAVVPASLLPDVQPYVEGGQLTALIATPRDGATYREAANVGEFARVAETGGPPVVSLLIGMLVALLVLGAGVGSRLVALTRLGGRGGEPA
jgi:hypothetical protein